MTEAPLVWAPWRTLSLPGDGERRGRGCIVKDYIGGLGGRDVNPATIQRMCDDILHAEAASNIPVWIDTKGESNGYQGGAAGYV